MDDIFQASADFSIKKPTSSDGAQLMKRSGKAHLDSVTSATSEFGEILYFHSINFNKTIDNR